MYSYSITQWLLFFFCYAFIGWIWECSFVTVKSAWKNKKWKFVNRGFLHGPVIPIYGFAAISILLVTLSIRENALGVFLLGALTATVFELVTGTAMEKMFKVKYWDYSDLPLNYNGHICLFVSLFWGFFSILLVQIIHVPIESILLKWSAFPSEIIAFIFIIFFTCDVTTSFQEAMDLRDLLESLSENNETIKRLERRFDAVVAFTPIPDIDDLRDMKLSAKENLNYHVERLRWKNEEHINKIKEYISLPEFDDLPDRLELLEKLELHRKKVIQKSNNQFTHATNLLKRNPNAKSEKYQEILDLLNDWIKE